MLLPHHHQSTAYLREAQEGSEEAVVQLGHAGPHDVTVVVPSVLFVTQRVRKRGRETHLQLMYSRGTAAGSGGAGLATGTANQMGTLCCKQASTSLIQSLAYISNPLLKQSITNAHHAGSTCVAVVPPPGPPHIANHTVLLMVSIALLGEHLPCPAGAGFSRLLQHGCQ